MQPTNDYTCMKLKKLSPLLLLYALLLPAVCFTSCEEDDDPYYTNILTAYNWELVAVNGHPVRELDVCEFEFYDFGNGTYGCYDSYGSWTTIPIEWDAASSGGGAQYLYVYPYDGTGQVWEYLMRLSGGYPALLELNDLATGDRLTFQAY